MKKFTFLFFSLLLTFTAKADKLLVSTIEGTPEHVYTIKNENGIVVGSNTVDVNGKNGVSIGEFAFYTAEEEGAYYIYSVTEGKWLDYTKAGSYSNTKNFVNLSETKNNYFKIEESNNKAGAAGRYQIRPYNNTGVAGKYLNYYQGADGSSKLGIWQESASQDNGSCYTFLYNDVEISDIDKLNNNIVYTLVTSRGWLMYNQNNPSVVASTASYKITTNAEASHFQWAIYKSKNNKYYLFNIAASCFIGKNSDEGGKFPFIHIPNNDIQIVKSEKGGYPFVFSTDNYGAINHFNHTAEPGVANWKGNANTGGLRSLSDDGSCHKVTAISPIDDTLLATIESSVECYENNPDLAAKQVSFRTYLGEVTAAYKDGNNWRISTKLNAYSQTEGDEDFATAFNEAYEYTTMMTTTVDEIDAQRTRIETLVRNLRINQPEVGKYYTLRSVASEMRRLSSVVSNDRYEMSKEGTGTINTTFLLEANGDNKTLLAYGTGLYMDTHAPVEVGATPATVVFTAAATKKGEYNIIVNDRYIYGQGNTQNNHIDSGSSNPGANSGYSWWIEEVNSLPVTISTAKYASFYAPVAVTIPEGVTAYYLKRDGVNVKDSTVTMTAIESNVIPAKTGVILHADVEKATTFNFAIADDAEAISGNILTGTVAKTKVEDDAYVLGIVDGEVGLYLTSDYEKYKYFTNGSHKAYLPSSAVKPGASQSAGFTFDFSGTTGIDEVKSEAANTVVEGIFDLMGRRVENPTRGIYIVNGKRVFIK